MEDLYSFLSSNGRFNPDDKAISREEIEEALKNSTYNELLNTFNELNDFFNDLAKIFKEERDAKWN